MAAAHPFGAFVGCRFKRIGCVCRIKVKIACLAFRMWLHGSSEVRVDQNLVWWLLLTQLGSTVNASSSTWMTRWTYKIIHSKMRSPKTLLLLWMDVNVPSCWCKVWSCTANSTITNHYSPTSASPSPNTIPSDHLLSVIYAHFVWNTKYGYSSPIKTTYLTLWCCN